MNMKLATIMFAAAAVIASPSYAYFDTTDVTEAYTILPNESAFWIPDTGDNASSQAKMDSEAYYEANKIAIKRFIVPHKKLSGTAGNCMTCFGWDAYVPTGRLIIVDRTPQSREWVKNENKGTNNHDESFPCQTKEGLNINVGISLGVEVKEENASKYLYHFGVLPPYVIGADGKKYLADRHDKATIFTSVYYGRSLADVTDNVVRRKVQTLMCNEIAARTFDAANNEMVKIMDAVEASSSKYLADYGITLDFIGYADAWEFDPSVQKAVNDKYAAGTLTPYMAALQDLNNLRVQEGLSKGLETHGLPIVIPENLLNAVTNLANHLVTVNPITTK